ncbi:uncharacterized protein LOC123547659 [Mercenaria mercenaria]|uniref:uncharacterized protein LOC123547659 n=1 Tax=Mercenaria mercenaria TaxID=6596 RepID=UPI00234E8245|nr:uncharacterized protein LOC123547659 [Mercenaria mercenaria]
MCENSEKNWKEFGSCTTTDIVVNELQRKTQYRFRIAAENKVGTGAFVELPVPIATEDILEWDYHDENTVKVKCGDSTVLQVPFKGAKPSVFLLHNDGPIQNMERISAETKDSCVYCHLHEVDHADQGKYTLTVENDTGRGTVVTTLTVLDKPSAPKKLTISDITSESCHLHWQKPDYENGSRITKYIVQICENRKMDWKEAGSSTNTDIVVNELQRKTQYRFRVAAENKVGIGAFGELSAPITTEDISGESQQTDNDTHPESGSPLSRSSNFERLLDEDQGETNFDEKNASVQFQMSSMTYTADDDWKELEYDKESSSVKVLDKKTDTGVANGKVKHNTHSVKDKEENKMELEGFFNKESQKSVPQKSLEYTLVKVGNNYILHSQIHEPVKISQITGELNVSVEDEYILIDGEIVYSISYESGQIMISKVEEAQFEIIKENQECSPSSITNDHHNEELIPCQREVKFNKNENLDSDIEKLTDGIKEFRIKDYQSRDSQNRYMEPTEDKNKECYVLVKNVPKGCSSESLWRDMIEPGFPVVPPLLIYHPKEKDALLICNSEADAAKLCRLGKFDVFEFEPHELCLHDPMITVDRAWLQLLASQQKYDEFVKKMKDIHVHVCTNGTVQAGTTYQLKVVKHIISDWKSLDITCKTIDNVSDNIWNVVSLVKQAHIGEFTANGGNIEFKNGKIHLSASNKDLLSDIFSVLQTYVNSLSKRVFLELPVNPEKKFPEENIKKWCSEIEEELEQECCVYNPKTNLVLAFCNTYENNMKVKYLLRVKKGEIKSTARGRRFTKESKNQEEPVETNKKILPVRDDVRERDFFQTKEGVKVYVCVADILNLDVDCIVNAANDRLQHGGGVAAAIQCGAGYALKKASRDYISKHGKLKAGEACTTTAGDLKYDCVIHAVGPCWSDYYPHNVEKVRECGMDLMDAVTNSFLEAEHHNLKSIALPAISSAIFGVPEKLCIYHYVKATVLYSRSYASKSKALKEIHFVDRNKDTIAKIRNMFEDWLGETASPPDFDINQFISKESGRSANSKKHEKSLHEKKNFPEVSSYLPTPLSYEEKWMTYAYIFCGVDDQKIVATIGNIFDSKASAVVVTINELGEYGTLGKQIFKKVNMSQASEYRRQLSNGLRVNKYLGGIIRTHGFDCGFNFIIHAVFPYYTRRNTLEQRQMDIQKTYWNIFCTAYLDKDISSVVLPLIGIGNIFL